MKTLSISVIIFLLSGCSIVGLVKSPEDKYYALNTAVVATARAVDTYVGDCKPKPANDPCKANMKPIATKLIELKKALATADKVFVTKDSQYYDLSLSLVENAINALKSLIKGETA